MEIKIHYEEVQRFATWWLWAILLGLAMCLLAFTVFKLHRTSMKQRPGLFGGLIILAMSLFGSLFLLGFLMIFKLETRIDNEHIYTRLFPLEWTFRQLDWENIESYSMRSYSPIMEYGGWGLRGINTRDAAINFWGDEGLQLVFKNGAKLLIGTQEPERLEAALHGE